MAAYVLEGPRWGTGAAGTSGGVVSWAIDGTVPTAFTAYLASAFAEWASHANIAFQQVASVASANIRFSDRYIDGLGNTLGEARYTYSGQTFKSASITFDSGEGWQSTGDGIFSRQGANLFVVALHEIGHTLGLGHYNAEPAVMNSVLRSSLTDLTASDIGGIQALYGAPAIAAAPTIPVVVPTPAPAPQPAPSPAPTPSGETADLNPVYRFFDTHTGDHFYTTSAAEKQQILQTIPWYTYEGVAWSAPDDGPNTQDVFRFYNTASGDHFFTTSVGERDDIIRTLPNYHYEGVAFDAYVDATAAGSGALTLERFFNTNSGLHHFAASKSEANDIRQGRAGAEWIDEGPGFIVHVPTDGMLHL